MDARLVTAAYQVPSAVHLSDNILAIAGTRYDTVGHATSDLADDISLGLNGNTLATARFAQSLVASRGRNLKRVTGHSLGAAVADEISSLFSLPAGLFSAPFTTRSPVLYGRWDPFRATNRRKDNEIVPGGHSLGSIAPA